MNELHDIAELLVAAWVLGAEDSEKVEPIPASHGILDRALRDALACGAFPNSWRDRLNFVESRVGLRCAELDAIIATAQNSELTSDPNPSYSVTTVKVGSRVARALLRGQPEVSEADAQKWGRSLRRALSEARKEQAEFPVSA